MNTRSWKSFSSVALFAAAFSTVVGCSLAGEPSGTSEPPVITQPPVAEPPVAQPTANPAGTGETKSVTIDNAVGGSVGLPNGTSISVPPGALPPGVDTITVTSAPEAAPSEYTATSPMYVFGPEGTVFLKPLKVTLPLTVPAGESLSNLTIYWSRASAEGFDIVPSEFVPVAGSDKKFIATAEITHFSRGFCGKKFKQDPHPAKDPYADK